MEAEKIYCTDGGDKALAYAAMANANRQDPMVTTANLSLAGEPIWKRKANVWISRNS